jgi:demethylmenaquinone methyltransferase/2-methoxy-6-polyprenyl-1,4-benzoquinol methylase
MLRVAEANLTPFTQVTTDASRIDAMTFHCTDARRLPQADQVADLVISAHMLEHLADPVAALREMHRVLKPGAPVLTIITRKGLLGSYLHRKWGVSCVQEEEACQWLHQAGFVKVRCVALHNPLLPCTWSSLACMGWRA